MPSARQILRRLQNERGFTATVVLTLAVCIGTNIAIFAVADAILARDLPFTEPDRLVTVINSYPGAGVERAGASFANYYERRGGIPAFSSIAIHQLGYATIGEIGSPARVPCDRVSPDFFPTLGVTLAMGRNFTEEEMIPGNSTRAILTDALWQTHFNADPQIIGKIMTVDSFPITIVGVLPPGFRYLGSHAQFFLPLASSPGDRKAAGRHSNNMGMIARLAPGLTIAVAQSQIDGFNAQQIADDPLANWVTSVRFNTKVYGLHADHVSEIRPILLLLQGGVLFLLLIGGANLVNLFLIRATGRSRDIVMRQALGAGTKQIAAELLAEVMILAGAGGLLGLVVGAAGVHLLKMIGSEQLPLGATIVFDTRVALVSCAATVAVGLLLALPVIWVSLQPKLAAVLQGGAHAANTPAMQRARHSFVVVQISMAFVLISGAAALGLALKRILTVPTGFNSEQVLTGTIALPWKGYPNDITRAVFVDRLLTELRAQPGVSAAGVTNGLPMSGRISDTATAVEGGSANSVRAHYLSSAGGEYWKVMGIPLIEGRLLNSSDDRASTKVCLVDKAFAERYWPGASPIGRRIANRSKFEDKEAHTIVGVVGSIKQTDLAEPDYHGAVYYPYAQSADLRFSLVLRTNVDPATLAPVLRKVVLQIDPSLPVDELKLMRTWIDQSLVSRRSPALLAGVFACMSLMLSAIGIYGVMAYAATQRRREVGIRLALGAQPKEILRQFLQLGFQLLLMGISIGILGVAGLDRAMKTIWLEMSPTDVGVLVPTAGAIVLVMLAAILFPCYRASRVSPAEALRRE